MNQTKIQLYHHKTDGGAEYLTDVFIPWEHNGKSGKEGAFEGAKYVVRIDGDITKDAALSVRHPSSDALTEEQEAEIGATIARLFCMKKSREHKDRFQMTWGDKTALGVFRTFKRVAEMLEAGEKIKA